MRRLISGVLMLIGAGIGGVFPGAFLAFSAAAQTGLSGNTGEALCLLVNLFLGIGGGLLGLIASGAIFYPTVRRSDVIARIVIGLITGAGGYVWCYWAISHADPPL
jgi:hypothetical protein